MAVVAFSTDSFKKRFPSFSMVDDEILEEVFQEATTVISNSSNSVIPFDPPRCFDRRVILYNLTAHILSLEGWDNESISSGDGGNGSLVGRVSHAEEGEAKIETEWAGEAEKGEAWYLQTPWGAKAWQYIRPYIQGTNVMAPPNQWRLPVFPSIGGLGTTYGGY